MKIAVHLHPQHATYTQIREAAIEAEEIGADVIYNWDHFYPLYGDDTGAHFEAWTMLASWAEVTSRVEIGCLVTCNSYRNPQLLADMARTVDHISDGRLILGIGSGWFEKDYDEYGYDFGTAVSRLRDLEGALPTIEGRIAALNPAPVRKMPVLIGGSGEKMTLKYVAQHADIWHTFANPEDPATYRHKTEVLERWCAEVGRNPADISRSLGLDWSEIDDIGAALDTFASWGVNEVTVGCGGPDYDMTGARAAIAWRDQ